jgi:hypothetical protein
MLATRRELEGSLSQILGSQQQEELRSYGNHGKKMLLLGKQMKNKLSKRQQKDLDTAVKRALETIDDFRTEEKGLNPMCGRTYTRPPEETLQQAALWDRQWREECHRRRQGQPDPEYYDEPGAWDSGT